MPANALRRRYGRFSAPPVSAVVFVPSEGWWVASFPSVPGAYSQGRTKAAAYANLLDAMAGLAELRHDAVQ